MQPTTWLMLLPPVTLALIWLACKVFKVRNFPPFTAGPERSTKAYACWDCDRWWLIRDYGLREEDGRCKFCGGIVTYGRYTVDEVLGDGTLEELL